MRLIKPNYEILSQGEGINGIYKQIELAGRTCYKSEDKITDSSAKEFVERLIKLGHGAMLEHGTVYLDIPCRIRYNDYGDVESVGSDRSSAYSNYTENKYSKVELVKEGWATEGNLYITTNYRVLVENGWLEDLKYLCEPTEFHEKRIAVKFICDRGVSHEFVRHRVFSFAQESTRYCNYGKDKFGNELTFIIPSFFEEDGTEERSDEEVEWRKAMLYSENSYFRLLNLGWSSQQARSVLPNSLKTELIMTGFASDWEGFFKLRDSASAHPQARELATPLHDYFVRVCHIK